MKKRFIIWCVGFSVLAMALLTAWGVSYYNSNKGWRHTTAIIEDGPFSKAFPVIKYPDNSIASQIQEWLVTVVPLGTHRSDAKQILERSFSTDLSSGEEIAVDYGSLFLSGHQGIYIKLIFDSSDKVSDIQVRQEWSYT